MTLIICITNLNLANTNESCFTKFNVRQKINTCYMVYIKAKVSSIPQCSLEILSVA